MCDMGGGMTGEEECRDQQLWLEPASNLQKILILYASQTGNAMDAAERVGREAERRGCPSAVVLSMDAYDVIHLPYENCIIFVVSTTGQGDIPDSMKVFWKFLLQKNLSSVWLSGVHYAVFGLGDSGYQKYNYTAKKLDRRLLNIGGKPLIEKGLGDDQHPSGYEATLDPWLSSLWDLIHQIKPLLLPNDSDILGSQRTLDSPKFQIIYNSANQVQNQSTTPDISSSQMLIGKSQSMPSGQFSNTAEMPQYLLRMTKNQRLTEEEQEKDVRHFEFESVTSVVEYCSGDVLEVLPGQNPTAVDSFINRCNLDPDIYITVIPKSIAENSSRSELELSNDPVKLKTFVELTMDVASASPRRYFFEVLSFFATAEHEKERLQYFTSPEGRDDLYQYNQKERRSVLEVLEDFPSVKMPFEWLVQLVPPLKTRAFSISSSPLVHPKEVHLTVSVVSWTSPFKRKRSGLCSSWLASLNPKDNSKEVYVPAWIHHGCLPTPQPSVPLILIGPGTGCAPFHAFIEERALQSVSQSTAPIIFFFGCRNKHGDYLYEDFWQTHAQDSGVLSPGKGGGLFVAFSRDETQKVYVQHKMKEESARVWKLLSAGAGVYIAGSSNKMPADVTRVLVEIISKEGGVSKEIAEKWLRQQERSGRFNVEAWS